MKFNLTKIRCGRMIKIVKFHSFWRDWPQLNSNLHSLQCAFVRLLNFIESGANSQCRARISRTAAVSPKVKNLIAEGGRDYLGNSYHCTISYLYRIVSNLRHNKTTNTYPPIENTVAEATALRARKANRPRFSDCLYWSLSMSGHPHGSSNRTTR